MKSKFFRIMTAVVLCCTMVLGCASCGALGKKKSPLDASNPTTITIWNYYNGDQLAAFDELVAEFNSTIGLEQGIAVVSQSQGSVNNVADGLIASAEGKVGSQELPTLAAVYGETAYILDQKGLLVNLDNYFTKTELEKYVPGFIEEGRFKQDGELLMFPVSKSTECFTVNSTDWAPFEAATGISISSINSYEKLTAASEKYYEWTDGLTPDVAEDGKALYGRDSVANYIFVGTKQLGHQMFNVSSDGALSVDMDKQTFRTLWDNYYIPFINGYFIADGSYRSDDMKVGKLLALTGSTSSTSYLPTSVTDSNDQKHNIDIMIEASLGFDGGETVSVQQGAGYCVVKGTEAQEYAAAEFLKWFTDPTRNLKFSISSGYSAVTREANSEDEIKASFGETDSSAKRYNTLNALLVSANVYTNQTTYTCKPFDGSKDVRNVLSDALENTAKNDRKTVLDAIAAGQTRQQAVAQFTTDEYFESWFSELCSAVENTVK